jgi:hypothetical protein
MEAGGELEATPMFMSFGRFEIVPRTPAGKPMISPESGLHKTPAAPDSAMAPPVMNPTPSSAVRAVPVSSQMNTMAPQSFISAACMPAHHASLSKMDFSNMKVTVISPLFLNKKKKKSVIFSSASHLSQTSLMLGHQYHPHQQPDMSQHAAMMNCLPQKGMQQLVFPNFAAEPVRKSCNRRWTSEEVRYDTHTGSDRRKPPLKLIFLFLLVFVRTRS